MEKKDNKSQLREIEKQKSYEAHKTVPTKRAEIRKKENPGRHKL